MLLLNHLSGVRLHIYLLCPNREPVTLIQVCLCKNCNKVKKWCKTLETELKELLTVSFETYKMTQYTIEDVRRRRDLRDYIQTIILHAQAARIPKDFYQLALAIYHHIDKPLRCNVPFLREGSTLNNIVAKVRKL